MESTPFSSNKAKRDVVQREIFFHAQLHHVLLGRGALAAFFKSVVNQLMFLEVLVPPRILTWGRTNAFLVVSEETLKNLCPTILEALCDGQFCFKGQMGVADPVALNR